VRVVGAGDYEHDDGSVDWFDGDLSLAGASYSMKELHDALMCARDATIAALHLRAAAQGIGMRIPTTEE
jgi:hypothetical protein